MSKKGFTLTELLAVIAIISIISLVAIPNIVNVVDNIKKQDMIDDANKLISLAKMKINSDYTIRKSGYHKFYYGELNIKGDITTDPDKGNYLGDSYVEYNVASGSVTYCIYLNGSKRRIGTSSSCVNESDLDNKNNVITK